MSLHHVFVAHPQISVLELHGTNFPSEGKFESFDRASLKAEQRLCAIPETTRSLLPTITNKTCLNALSKESEFAHLDDSLMRNRTPSRPTGEKTVVFDIATNQLKTNQKRRKRKSSLLWTPQLEPFWFLQCTELQLV